MNKENKIILNNNKIISYSSFLNRDNDEEANPEDLQFINDDVYLNIDSKNYLSEASEKEIQIINQRISNLKGNIINSDEKENSKENLTKQIIKKFLDKLYPKCETSGRKISLLISREIGAKKKLSKDTIEEYIDYFHNLRHDIIYSNALKLSKEVFRNIGYIFCYIYDKFTQLSIKDNVWLKECIKKIIDNNIDVTSDYYFYCNENGIDPALTKKTKIWKNLRKNYEMPPEFIFLINMFHRMETLDINIEFDGETLSDEDIKLFTITILNINYISPKLEHLNLNFIHNKLQFSL